MAFDGYILRGGVVKVALYRANELLGEGEVVEMPDIKSTGRSAFVGPFKPTAAFAPIWPMFAEKQQLAVPIVQTLRDLPTNASPESIRDALSAPTTVMPALAAVKQRIAALDLAIRDEAGNVRPELEADIFHFDLLSDSMTVMRDA